ncbi:hypothetical protein [Rhodobium gokarnense]|uniref:Uncharacterized protein n=1 Tax=Rhodobium gokarnense TaxID=364296 RepID=A0ABT3HDC3_9HYPH|nr:hypothetical protein [Rhodobium gokarnense]MCW2308380.1 hypothetical protein [Rhodobium gokarnense]
MDGSHAQRFPVVETRALLAFSVTHTFSGAGDIADGALDGGTASLFGDVKPLPTRVREGLVGAFERRRRSEPAIEMLRTLRDGAASAGLRDRIDTLFRRNGHWLFDSIEWVLARSDALRRELSDNAQHVIRLPIGDDGRKGDLLAPVHLGYLLYQCRDRPDLAARYEDEARAIDRKVLECAGEIRDGLVAAEAWYADVLAFFCREPWVPSPGGRAKTLAECLQEVFPGAARSGAVPLVVNACGAPDAYACERTSDRVLAAVFDDGSAPARRLLNAMTATQKKDLLTGTDLQLRAVAGNDTAEFRLHDWREAYRSGLVREEEHIRFDIGNPIASIPELALHEMTHLAYAAVRPVVRLVDDGRGTPLLVRVLDRTLEEGVAEFFSERALAGIGRPFPLASDYRNIRLGLLRSDPDDPHVAGYARIAGHFRQGRFRDADGFLEAAASADFDFVRLLDAWGDADLPRSAIENAMAVVPAMRIEIGDTPTVRSVEFQREWCDEVAAKVLHAPEPDCPVSR